jgi:hypothetical protein
MTDTNSTAGRDWAAYGWWYERKVDLLRDRL